MEGEDDGEDVVENGFGGSSTNPLDNGRTTTSVTDEHDPSMVQHEG